MNCTSICTHVPPPQKKKKKNRVPVFSHGLQVASHAATSWRLFTQSTAKDTRRPPEQCRRVEEGLWAGAGAVGEECGEEWCPKHHHSPKRVRASKHTQVSLSRFQFMNSVAESRLFLRYDTLLKIRYFVQVLP